jgi:hypothetical protein
MTLATRGLPMIALLTLALMKALRIAVLMMVMLYYSFERKKRGVSSPIG